MSLTKLNPMHMVKNPVMFITEVGAAVTTVEIFFARAHGESVLFVLQIAFWLWFTVLFANFAEAMAEGRGKAQADALRKSRTKTNGRKLDARRHNREQRAVRVACARATCLSVKPTSRFPPTARSSKARRRSTNRPSPANPRRSSAKPAATARPSPAAPPSCPTSIIVRVTANPGETFMDRMIGLIEGAKRQKTPNEIALNILLAGVDDHLPDRDHHAQAVCRFTPQLCRRRRQASCSRHRDVLVSLLVCLIPTTIGGLLGAIGIAGIDRMVQHNVLAMSGRAVEAAGDVDVLLLDKTGTITLGNRQATEFIPAPGVSRRGAGRCRPAFIPCRRNARRPQHRRAGQGAIWHSRPGDSRVAAAPSSSRSPPRRA